MSHTEFDAVDGKYPQVSDFGRVLLWHGPNRDRRYMPEPGVGEAYSRVKINGLMFPTASLVLNAFEGAPEDGETAVGLRSALLWSRISSHVSICNPLTSDAALLQDHITSTEKGNNRWSKEKGKKEFGNLQWAAATCEAAESLLHLSPAALLAEEEVFPLSEPSTPAKPTTNRLSNDLEIEPSR